jgi:hypothetical protein
MKHYYPQIDRTFRDEYRARVSYTEINRKYLQVDLSKLCSTRWFAGPHKTYTPFFKQ